MDSSDFVEMEYYAQDRLHYDFGIHLVLDAARLRTNSGKRKGMASRRIQPVGIARPGTIDDTDYRGKSWAGLL